MQLIISLFTYLLTYLLTYLITYLLNYLITYLFYFNLLTRVSTEISLLFYEVSQVTLTLDNEQLPVSLSDYHLLVTSSLELAVVYT